MPLLLPEAEPVDLTGEESLDAYTAAASTASGPRFLTGVGDWAQDDYESLDVARRRGHRRRRAGRRARRTTTTPPSTGEVAARRKIRARGCSRARASARRRRRATAPGRRARTRRAAAGPHDPGHHRCRPGRPGADLPEARPRRDDGARHRDRRARVARALPGPPAPRLPARHDPRRARLDRDRAARVPARRVRVPVHDRDRHRLHPALVPARGRARPPDRERRGHRAGLRLRRRASAASPGCCSATRTASA